MRQLVLGLDVSELRTGWGVADIETAEPVDCGCKTFANWSNDDSLAIRRALAHIPHGGIAAVHIEAPHVGINRAGAMRHAMTIGSVWQACSVWWPDAPIEFVQPDAWKKRVGVEPTPRGMKSKRAQRMAAIEFGALGSPDLCLPDEWQAQILKADKPFVYLRALELGFKPNGSQDAADAGLIAVAGALINAETVRMYEARKGVA